MERTLGFSYSHLVRPLHRRTVRFSFLISHDLAKCKECNELINFSMFFFFFVISRGFLIMSLHRRFQLDDHGKDECLTCLQHWRQRILFHSLAALSSLSHEHRRSAIIYDHPQSQIERSKKCFVLFVDFTFQSHNATIDFTRLSAIAACKWALIMNDFWWEIMISCWTQKSTGSTVKI